MSDLIDAVTKLQNFLNESEAWREVGYISVRVGHLEQKLIEAEWRVKEAHELAAVAKEEANKQTAYANSIANQIDEQRGRVARYQTMIENLWTHHFNAVPKQNKGKVRAWEKFWSVREAKGRLRKFREQELHK